MKKSELVDAMAQKANLSKADVKKALDAFVSVATGALKGGDCIGIVGFGTFDVMERGERNVRNTRSGQVMKCAAKKYVKFKPGAGLKNTIN